MTPPPTVQAEPRDPSWAPDSIAPRRRPPHSGTTGPGHCLSGGPPPPQSLLPVRPPSLPDDGREVWVCRADRGPVLAGEEWAPRTWPSPGGPPTWMWHQGSGGTGGWADPFVASQSPALGWPGLCRGAPGRATALRTLLPGQLPPLAAPPPSSAWGGTSKMGTPCHTAKRWKPPECPLRGTDREDP